MKELIPPPHHSTTQLLHLMNENQVPHGILLESPEIDKSMNFALWIASFLLCPQKGCGNCYHCLMVAKLQHPDFILIQKEEKKTEIVVDQIRQIKASLFLSPTVASCKVFWLMNGDDMNHNSQNALLKSLEEPPGNNYFLLSVFHQKSLLPTILSRVTSFSLPSSSVKHGNLEQNLPSYHFSPPAKGEADYSDYIMGKKLVTIGLTGTHLERLSLFTTLWDKKNHSNLEPSFRFGFFLLGTCMKSLSSPSFPPPAGLERLCDTLSFHDFSRYYYLLQELKSEYKSYSNPTMFATHCSIQLKNRLEQSI